MAKHSSDESSEWTELEKKLRKREKKLRGRLQEARDAQSDALDRLKRAERRLDKRTARTQSLETRLTLTQHQLNIMLNPETQPARDASVSDNAGSEQRVAQPSLAEQSVFEEQNEPVVPVGEEREELEQLIASLRMDEEAPVSQNGGSGESSDESNQSDETDETDGTINELTLQVKNVVSPAEVGRLAKIARSVAETAERAARVAIERAVEVASRLEQMNAGRHLMQELTQTQSEADRASALAQQAQRAAAEAERLMAETELEDTREAGELANTQEEMTEEQLLSDLEAMALEDEVFAGGTETTDDEEQEDEDASPPESIEDIEDEEEMIEAIASKLIADAAAAAAAQAEALAEASSSRTHEARQNAARADRMLDEARATILNGSLDEQGAQTRLQDAERAATRAHALLADAEATEEAARNAARNAEAEAEVAEGMAFATGDIAEHQLEADIANLLEHEQTPISNENNANGDDVEYNDDNDATDKIPRP